MIAIKGMKMPQKCEVCRFNLGGEMLPLLEVELYV